MVLQGPGRSHQRVSQGLWRPPRVSHVLRFSAASDVPKGSSRCSLVLWVSIRFCKVLSVSPMFCNVLKVLCFPRFAKVR